MKILAMINADDCRKLVGEFEYRFFIILNMLLQNAYKNED
jgi:hypothetical protein|tara:strand:+ start:61 stop:180 length:120 start_codon:yes stop_codon:yes gene_type:complete